MKNVLGVFRSLEMNELHRAVRENRLEGVQFLIANGSDIANTIDGGSTPLHLACNLNLPRITRELLKNKSRDELRQSINMKTAYTGIAALHLATMKNSLENARLLLSCGARFDIPDNDGESPQSLSSDKNIYQLFSSIQTIFNVVSSNDSLVIVEALNSCAHDDLAAVTYSRNSENRTALQMAMMKLDLDGVGEIIDFRMKKLKQNPWQPGAKIDGLMQHSKATRLLLNRLDKYRPKSEILSLDFCFKNIVLDLLHEAHEFSEAYKQQRDPSLDEQPLLIILEESLEFFGSWETSKFIENIGVVRTLCKGVQCVVSMLKLCILAPVQLFMRLVYTSELLEAAKQNNLAMVERCLTGHPDLNEEDADNHTALRYAFERKNYEMAKLLLSLGADPTSEKTRQNEPLLHFALRRMKESWPIDAHMMQLLFERVSDDEKSINFVNARSANHDATALHWVSNDDRRLAQFLLSKGAIYCAKDSRDYAPKDYCTRYEGSRSLYDEIHRLFAYASCGQTKELLEAMEKLDDVLDLLAVAGARNEERQTLVQVLELKGHVDEAEQIRKLMSSDEADRCKRSTAEFLCRGPDNVRGSQWHVLS